MPMHNSNTEEHNYWLSCSSAVSANQRIIEKSMLQGTPEAKHLVQLDEVTLSPIRSAPGHLQ